MEPCGTPYIDNASEEVKPSTDNELSVRKAWWELMEGSPGDINPCSQPFNNNAIIHRVKHGAKIKQNQHRAFTCTSLHQDMIDNSYKCRLCAALLSETRLKFLKNIIIDQDFQQRYCFEVVFNGLISCVFKVEEQLWGTEDEKLWIAAFSNTYACVHALMPTYAHIHTQTHTWSHRWSQSSWSSL